MPVLGLNHYNLRAPRALMVILKNFYCDVVGLEDGPRPAFSSVGYWLYAGGLPVLHLSEITDATSIEIPQPSGKVVATNTFDHAAFTCASLQAIQTHLTAHNVAYKIVFSPVTRQTQLFFKDPGGNGVELNFDEERA
ncbi:VOC family protein [Glaciimonas immobilis]|uniref:Extradiol dioxygenase family protein n=1 Tax=Glaciimonas immobilis TaxID=728004 RepID=A0A840RYZ1_9BURK|nr:VOC family protein [Glaciimonas immobilis]KAF3998431.1 diguanylate cyclase [Glaciimonas immobilis]MBB5202076.1 extradiol dioxygenase family protein [Glaciimonas immobilis]